MKRRLLMAVLAAMATRAVVWAQQTEPADTLLPLDEVVVTGAAQSRAATSTAPLHRMDRGQMLRMGIGDMADALHRLPGITLRDYGGAGGMKTVSVRGFGTKHTGVSYDGVMLSDCQGGEIDVARYSLDNVAHLQLTIGDNDDIFIPARQATTPAMLAIETSHRPDGDDRRAHLTAQVKAGSFGYVSPFAKYEQRLSPRLWLSALGEYTHADNDYPYTLQNVTQTIHDRRTHSRMDQGHGEVNLRWQQGASTLTAKAYYYDNDRELPGQVRYYTNVSREQLRERNAMAQALFQTHSQRGLSLKWLARFNWAASLYDDGEAMSQVTDANYWQREAYTSACLLWQPGERWALDYSADYSFNNLNSTLPNDARPYRHTILQSATARYQHGPLSATARLLASIYQNGTAQGESARNLRRLSPSLSVAYEVVKGWRLRAAYKDIFRTPTFNENYFFHFGTSTLEPEQTAQLNLGTTWEGRLSRAVEARITADVYRNEVEDMIVAVPFNMFVWRYVNVGKVKVLGADATANATARLGRSHRLTLAANYSLQRAQNRTNPASPNYRKQIAYMPEHSGSGSVGWENPWLNAAFSGHSVSRRWATNEHLEDTDISGYTEFGLTFWRDLELHRAGKLHVRADVKNLFDRQYELVKRYPMPRRSMTVTLKYTY